MSLDTIQRAARSTTSSGVEGGPDDLLDLWFVNFPQLPPGTDTKHPSSSMRTAFNTNPVFKHRPVQ